MAYFVAVLARDGKQWESHDVDVEQTADLTGLADALREVAVDDEPVLLLLEYEDVWFAIVRVDGAEDPRVFVSDAAAASASPYAERLGVEALDEELADEPVGDFDVVADLDTSPERLRAMCDGELARTSGEALSLIAEAAGFEEELESLR